MAPTDGRVAKPERRWDCRRGTLTTRTRQTSDRGGSLRLAESSPCHEKKTVSDDPVAHFVDANDDAGIDCAEVHVLWNVSRY